MHSTSIAVRGSLVGCTENGFAAGMSAFAGYAGAVQGMRAWCYAKLNGGKQVDPIKPNTKAGFVEQIKADFDKIGSKPTALVLGAKGRCVGIGYWL
jgi:hypothetical protein